MLAINAAFLLVSKYAYKPAEYVATFSYHTIAIDISK